MTRTEENILLGALGRSEDKAFIRLYDEYAKAAYAFVVAILKDETVAKDIVQETFVKIWLRRSVVSKVTSFKAYLFKMLRNSVFNHFESADVFHRYLDWAANRPQDDFSYDSVYFRELWGLVMEAVDLMPSQRKRVFEMSRMEARSNKEISETLGINQRTVENHLANALRDVREYLLRYYA